MNIDARLTAKLFSACPPDGTQKAKLEAVLSKSTAKPLHWCGRRITPWREAFVSSWAARSSTGRRKAG